MALTATYADIVTGLGADGFQSLTKLQAAQANEYILQNLMYQKARPVVGVSDFDGTVDTTTNTSFENVTGATLSITTSGDSKLLITANWTWGESSSATAYMTVLVDGTNQGHATNGMQYATIVNAPNTAALTFITAAAVADGAHTVKLQYRTSANTLTVYAYSLVVQEVG